MTILRIGPGSTLACKYDWEYSGEGERAAPASELAFIRQRKHGAIFSDDLRYGSRRRGHVVSFAKDEDRRQIQPSVLCLVSPPSIPPISMLLFERFLSDKRMNVANVHEPLDIDVDFEHERREEIIQHMYTALWARAGRDRRDGDPLPAAQRDAGSRKSAGPVGRRDRAALRPLYGAAGEALCRKPSYGRRASIRTIPCCIAHWTAREELPGFPRHLSQHVGGFVLTRGRLDETAPIGNAAMDDRTFIEWDKDDIDALGLMKVDVLGAGDAHLHPQGAEPPRRGKAAERYAVEEDYPGSEDPAVYDMLRRADSSASSRSRAARR